jgi:hypothetical protein
MAIDALNLLGRPSFSTFRALQSEERKIESTIPYEPPKSDKDYTWHFVIDETDPGMFIYPITPFQTLAKSTKHKMLEDFSKDEVSVRLISLGAEYDWADRAKFLSLLLLWNKTKPSLPGSFTLAYDVNSGELYVMKLNLHREVLLKTMDELCTAEAGTAKMYRGDMMLAEKEKVPGLRQVIQSKMCDRL